MDFTELKPTTIVGLDISLTSTGFCVIQKDGTVKFGSIATPGDTISGFDRIHKIRQSIDSIVSSGSLVMYEGFSHGSHFRAHDLGMIQGVVRYHLWLRKVVMQPVAPLQLKKFLVGNAKVEKNAIMMNVLKKFRLEPANDDEADAIVLARIGLVLIRPELAEHKYEKEILETLQRGKPAKKRKKKKILGEAA